MDKLKEWGDQHPVYAWVLALTCIIGGFAIIGLSGDTDFMFRPDKFHIPHAKNELQVFIVVCIFVLVGSRVPKEYWGYIIGTVFMIIVSICSFKAYYLSQLKHSDIPFITTYASVSNYYSVSSGRGSESKYYTLSFHNKIPISNHNLEITWSKNHAISRPNEGDCVKMKYRENALLIEFHFIENLGKMSVNECWETAR